MGAKQKDFASANGYVGFFDLSTAGAYRLDLPTLERHASLEAFFDEVVMKRFFVVDDAHGVVCSLLKLWARQAGCSG